MSVVTKQPKASIKKSGQKGRQRLIETSMQLFAEKGFGSVTVRDIAREAGVSIGLISHHFDSKEGLREAVDQYFIERTSKAIERDSKQLSETDFDGIEAYHRNWISQYGDEWPIMASYLRRAIIDGSEWGEKLFTTYYQEVASTIARADAEQKVSDEADRLWLPLLYMFLLIGPLILDPYIKSMLGRSTYESEMWGRFQKAMRQLYWMGASPRS